MSRAVGTLILIGITVIWGTTFVIVKDLVANISVPALLALRFSLAGALLIGSRPKPSSLRAGGVLGVLLFAGFATQTLGLQYTSASRSAFITGLSVILTPLLGALWLKQRLGARAYLACAVALVGLGLLTLTDIGGGINRGDLWTLGTAIAYAIYIVYLGEVAPRHSAAALSAVQIWLVALLAWLWLAPNIRELAAVSWPALAAIGYLALFPTVITSILQTQAQRVVPAHVAAIIFVLEPVFAALFAYLLLGERLGLQGLLGGGLVVLAMAISQWQLPLAPQPAAQPHGVDRP